VVDCSCIDKIHKLFRDGVDQMPKTHPRLFWLVFRSSEAKKGRGNPEITKIGNTACCRLLLYTKTKVALTRKRLPN
jgi:hypothetical protein